MEAAEITMGPLMFHWPSERKRDFWFRIADEAPVDSVYIGETVCSKRAAEFNNAQLIEVAERLKRGGKRVVWTTLSEVVTQHDRKHITDVCSQDGAEIEVNDISGLWHLTGRSHRIGQALNVYNEGTLAFLAGNGATHFCLPSELPKDTIAAICAKAEDIGVGVEVQVFGRVSLALSARCYHARAHGRSKDNCLFVCGNDPDGLELETRSNKPFLIINGIQTLSHRYLNLAREMKALEGLGVSAFRLGPHACDMVAVASCYRALLDDAIDAEAAERQLAALGIPQPMANGFFHGRPGLDLVLSGPAGRELP